MEMPTTATVAPAERNAVVAIDDLVNELAQRVGKMIPRRNDARYPMHAALTIGVLRDNGVFDVMGAAWGFDLGSQGLGMISDKKLPAGDEIHVKLRGLDGQDHLIPMRVTHTERLFGNVYRIGGQFLFNKAA
jgi:hypothetical protein